MKILVIGSGGREHAITWRLAKEGHEVVSSPGNPGMAELGQTISAVNYLEVADAVSPDFTVVGPEAPLVEGIVDRFQAAGRKIVGPNQKNAQLEGSKIYSKQLMDRLGIPTARFVRTEDESAALAALKKFDLPVVVKADGLAAGKGVIIAQTAEEAEAAVKSLGPKLVIEEFLVGEEVSFIALCDGKRLVAFDASQDHKQVHDSDQGPNTGGMGAYTDGRIFTPEQAQQTIDTVMMPVIEATAFTGFLYAGLMMTAAGPKVLEFNVRMGDPETQPLLHRLDSPLAEVLLAAATGDLSGMQLSWKSEPSVCVVMAAHGYPATPRKGDEITGIGDCDSLPGEVVVFQAGTKQNDGRLETSGGRVLGVTARGADLQTAIDNAYGAVKKIHFDGAHYRTDIGKKGLKRW